MQHLRPIYAEGTDSDAYLIGPHNRDVGIDYLEDLWPTPLGDDYGTHGTTALSLVEILLRGTPSILLRPTDDAGPGRGRW